MHRTRWILGAACLAAPVLAFAHYPIVTPPAWQATKGEEVVFSYTFGHPFEVELATAARPTRVAVYPPKAETVDVTETLSVRDADDPTAGFEFRYTPQVRGDHWVVVEASSQHGDERTTDYTKLALHVSQVQAGWARTLNLPLELVPLTRPYGIPAGAVFRATALEAGKPLGGALVSVEYKHTTRPAELPPEPLITRVERTAPDGTFMTTLDKPGWWILSVEHDEGRGNLWVWVGR